MMEELNTSVLNASFNQKRLLPSDKYSNNHVGDIGIQEAPQEATKITLDP